MLPPRSVAPRENVELPASVATRGLIEFSGLEKRFVTRTKESVLALTDINLKIGEGEIVTVVGPSGCGKTTLLRILAGLEQQSSGHALIGGRPIVKPSPEVAVVFQSATLLPWYTAIENVLLPARIQGEVVSKHIDRAQALLAMTGLCDFARKYPRELSGGMQQRVSICRALMRDPRFPKLLGATAIAGGVPTAIAGVVMAYTGFSDLAMNINLPANSLVLCWMIALGVYVLSEPARLVSPSDSIGASALSN